MIRETFDIAYVIESLPKILKALPVTLLLTGAALLAGWIIGLLIAWGKISGPAPLRKILNILTDIIRGIPTVVLLYIVYFGLPNLVLATTGANIDAWPKELFVIIALVIELMITASEMFRSAYLSIDKGQLDAAHSLGYTKAQRFVHVIFPQGAYVILPNLGSAVLAMVQATALVYTLGIFDILGKARQMDVSSTGTKSFELFFTATLIYWGLAAAITWLFKLIEKQSGKGFRSVGSVKESSGRKAAVK